MGFQDDFPKRGVDRVPVVYAFVYEPTDEVLYIGQSGQAINRIGNHLSRKTKGYVKGMVMQDPDSDIDAEGSDWDNVSVYVKELPGLSEQGRKQYERKMKQKYDPVYDGEQGF